MELYKEILAAALMNEKMSVTFPGLEQNLSEIVESVSYQALQKIKLIVENDELSDFECAEEIVCVLESIGSGGGLRHDFG